MAEGLSISLPLRIDPVDGAYGLNKTLTQLAGQNLRMVILTSPGERMMMPEFGVGVRNYLFEQNTASTAAALRERIRQQVSTYVPYVSLLDLRVLSQPDVGAASSGMGLKAINIYIKYSVPSANVVSDLTIPITV